MILFWFLDIFRRGETQNINMTLQLKYLTTLFWWTLSNCAPSTFSSSTFSGPSRIYEGFFLKLFTILDMLLTCVHWLDYSELSLTCPHKHCSLCRVCMLQHRQFFWSCSNHPEFWMICCCWSQYPSHLLVGMSGKVCRSFYIRIGAGICCVGRLS